MPLVTPAHAVAPEVHLKLRSQVYHSSRERHLAWNASLWSSAVGVGRDEIAIGVASDVSHGQVALDTHAGVEDAAHYHTAHPTEAGKRSLVGISQIEACSCTSAQLHPVLQFVIALRVQAKCGEQAKQDYCRKKPSLLRRPRHTSRLAIIQMYLSLSTALAMGPLTPSSALGR